MKTQKVTNASNFKHEIPLIGFGAMGISEFYGDTDEAAAQLAIKTAIKNGINHFDTADCYSFGDNEVFLGKSLNLKNSEIREKLIIASKAGIIRDRNDANARAICIKPEYLKKQLIQSLKNLETSYLDIFYIHRLPPDAPEQDLIELANFLLELKQLGLAKSIGLSEPSLEQLHKIHAVCPISFVQSEYSILERGVEKSGILGFCKASNISFVAYSPLCRGLLTDQFDLNKLDSSDFRAALPKFSGENYVENKKIIQQLKDIAKDKGVSLSSLALAWLRAQNVLVIPGMRKADRALDAIASLHVELTAVDLTKIDTIAYLGATKGSRYTEAAMKSFGFKS